MKYTLNIFFATLLIHFSFAQELHEHACAKSKINNAILQESSHKNLSDQDKYDLNYVKLDLSLDNLSTTISRGHATLKGTVTAFTLDIFVCELESNILVDSAKINGITVNINRPGDELQLFSNTVLNQGEAVVADIYYHGAAPVSGGFFGGIFNASSPSWGAKVTWTLSQPFSAHTWWPAKQVLTDKIDSSEVWLTVPNNLKAGSNGLLINEVALPGNKTRFEWKHQHMIDYYLISMAVGPYIDYSFMAALPGTSDSVLIQNYIYDNPNTLPNFLNDINLTADMLYVFSELYGLYPFRDEKYGHCMAPLSGGMEHQTMTTQGFFETGLTAHELGHQWFGDNVTCEDWGHIWVNEGFASYSEYLFYQSFSQNQANQQMTDVHNNVLSQLGGSVFVPIGSQGDDGRMIRAPL
jgi:aminopeptidase N